jgi:hypothetical protein
LSSVFLTQPTLAASVTIREVIRVLLFIGGSFGVARGIGKGGDGATTAWLVP